MWIWCLRNSDAFVEEVSVGAGGLSLFVDPGFSFLRELAPYMAATYLRFAAPSGPVASAGPVVARARRCPAGARIALKGPRRWAKPAHCLDGLPPVLHAVTPPSRT